MRFMMFMCLPEGTREEDWNPAPEDVAAMTRYNEELRKAGMLLSLDGLHPPAEAARGSFDAEGQRTVTAGPCAAARAVVGGSGLSEARSRAEAIEWASRVPGRDCTVEVRRVFEMADFPEDLQEAFQREWGGE